MILFFSLDVQAEVPLVSYVKAIDIWMGACTAFIFAALLEFTLTNYLWRKGRKGHKMSSRRMKELVMTLGAEGVLNGEDVLAGQQQQRRQQQSIRGYQKSPSMIKLQNSPSFSENGGNSQLEMHEMRRRGEKADYDEDLAVAEAALDEAAKPLQVAEVEQRRRRKKDESKIKIFEAELNNGNKMADTEIVSTPTPPILGSLTRIVQGAGVSIRSI